MNMEKTTDLDSVVGRNGLARNKTTREGVLTDFVNLQDRTFALEVIHNLNFTSRGTADTLVFGKFPRSLFNFNRPIARNILETNESSERVYYVGYSIFAHDCFDRPARAVAVLVCGERDYQAIDANSEIVPTMQSLLHRSWKLEPRGNLQVKKDYSF